MIQIKMGHLGYLCNYAVPVKIHIFRFFFICNPLMSAVLFTYSSQRDADLMEQKKQLPLPLSMFSKCWGA